METQNLLNEYERSNHSVGISMWHFEWCTKYRYKMFKKEEYKNLATACIRRAASLHQLRIIELNVQPEHVHCVVAISLIMSPAQALNILKGLSARLFFKHHEKARLRYPRGHLWSPGKFFRSVGCVTAEVVESYIKNSNKWEFEYLKQQQRSLTAY